VLLTLCLAVLCSVVLCCAVLSGEKRQEITAQRGQQAVLLADHDRDRLEDMLRGLTAERTAIAEVRTHARRSTSGSHAAAEAGC
jgi:hypothetical protein